jgi:hypothetical protein
VTRVPARGSTFRRTGFFIEAANLVCPFAANLLKPLDKQLMENFGF